MAKTRRPKTQRVPRTRAGGTWTEAQFWNWLVNGLRKQSMRWPPLQRIWSDKSRDDVRPNTSDGLHKWEHRCANCGAWLPRKDMHADHIEPSLPLTKPDHIGPYVMRLFCETSGLQKLCIACNYQRRNEQRARKKADRS